MAALKQGGLQTKNFDRIATGLRCGHNSLQEAASSVQQEINREEIIMKVSNHMKKRLAKQDSMGVSLLATLQVMTKLRPTQFSLSKENALTNADNVANAKGSSIKNKSGNGTTSKTNAATEKRTGRFPNPAHSVVNKREKVIVSKRKKEVSFVPNASTKRIASSKQTPHKKSVQQQNIKSQKSVEPTTVPLNKITRKISGANNNTKKPSTEGTSTQSDKTQTVALNNVKCKAAEDSDTTMLLTETKPDNITTSRDRANATAHKGKHIRGRIYKTETVSNRNISIRARKYESLADKEKEMEERRKSANSSIHSQEFTMAKNMSGNKMPRSKVRTINPRNLTRGVDDNEELIGAANDNESLRFPNSMTRKPDKNRVLNQRENNFIKSCSDGQDTADGVGNKSDSNTHIMTNKDTLCMTSGSKDTIPFSTRNMKNNRSKSKEPVEKTSNHTRVRSALHSSTTEAEDKIRKTNELFRSKSNRDVLVSPRNPTGKNIPAPTKSHGVPRTVSPAFFAVKRKVEQSVPEHPVTIRDARAVNATVRKEQKGFLSNHRSADMVDLQIGQKDQPVEHQSVKSRKLIGHMRKNSNQQLKINDNQNGTSERQPLLEKHSNQKLKLFTEQKGRHGRMKELSKTSEF